MSLPLCNQYINIQPPQTRISPHIADMARTIKAVLKKKNIFTLMGKTKIKTKTEKIHEPKNKQKEKKKISGQV